MCPFQSTEMKWIHGEDNVVQSSEDKTLRVWDTRTCSAVQQTPPKQHIQVNKNALHFVTINRNFLLIVTLSYNSINIPLVTHNSLCFY